MLDSVSLWYSEDYDPYLAIICDIHFAGASSQFSLSLFLSFSSTLPHGFMYVL